MEFLSLSTINLTCNLLFFIRTEPTSDRTKMDTVTLPKEEFEHMKKELETLRNSTLYKRLLDARENVKKEKFTRADVGF